MIFYFLIKCLCFLLLRKVSETDASMIMKSSLKSTTKEKLTPITESTEPPSGQVIRLRGGDHPWEGEVQVYVDGAWGVLCNRSWIAINDDIICRQLGFSRGAVTSRISITKKSSLNFARTDIRCHGNETSLLHCPMTKRRFCSLQYQAAYVQCLKNRASPCDANEVFYNNSCYLFVSEKKDHKGMREHCRLKLGRALVTENQQENDFISDWLINTNATHTWRIGDVRKLWRWDFNNLRVKKFTKWFPGELDHSAPSPRCVQLRRMDKTNRLLDYYFWFGGSCEEKLPFICKKKAKNIGCISGNGANYKGTASVSHSGKECIRWNDRSLTRNFVSETIFNSTLQSHNYCRSLDDDDAPWCFIDGRRFEYCDIPPCHSTKKRTMVTKTSQKTRCRDTWFQCSSTQCIHRRWVCDREDDCLDGSDELNCTDYTNNFVKYDDFGIAEDSAEVWRYLSLADCSRKCFVLRKSECLSFSYRERPSTCLLSQHRHLGKPSLLLDSHFVYYERPRPPVDCGSSFACKNGRCVNSDLKCDGKDDCFDKSDESDCVVEQDINFSVRLVSDSVPNEGRLEVRVRNQWGIVCDDLWDLRDATVACKELGFPLGAAKALTSVEFGSGNGVYLMDDVECVGNETSLSECAFNGWGDHNCGEKKAAGVICKTEETVCGEQYFRCSNGKCILLFFLCDNENDCGDNSDETDLICLAPLQIRLSGGETNSSGRVEVKFRGVWGTVCDDQWDDNDAKVVCRMLGFHGPSKSQSEGWFGAGTGPIWINNVQCIGHENSIAECDKTDWLKNNCQHKEDAGVTCSPGLETTSMFPDFRDLLPSQCGIRTVEDGPSSAIRVIGGFEAPYGAHPWQVGIRKVTWKSSMHWCGGSIISEYFILSAAHCFDLNDGTKYAVRVGDHNLYKKESEEAEFKIERIYQHSEYDKGARFNNDIALVKVKPENGHGIQFGYYVQPICLPSVEDLYTPGLKCIVSGWGSTGLFYSQSLRAAEVSIFSQTKCSQRRSYGQNRLTTGMFCAGDPKGGVDSCQGDSGGPLACNMNGRQVLMGIISWGTGCALADKPGVYVRVQNYMGWLVNAMKS